jgi:uncharacterized protein YpmB
MPGRNSSREKKSFLIPFDSVFVSKKQSGITPNKANPKASKEGKVSSEIKTLVNVKRRKRNQNQGE